MVKPVPYITRDGSHTLYSQRYGQYYHNPNGAIAESLHVFYRTTGLETFPGGNRPFTILETGFGTGLNFLLLLYLRQKAGHTAPVLFQSVEAWPPDPDTIATVNYPELLGHSEYRDLLASVFGNLQPGKNNEFAFGDVTLRVFCGMFDVFDPGEINSDYIFHDPFSPDVNPELWTSQTFRQLAVWSSPDSLLATYSAATSARAAMAHAGWLAARCPGALGKREMTLASRDPGRLMAYKRVNEKRLAQRYESGDFG